MLIILDVDDLEDEDSHLCCLHGTPLSIAYKVLFEDVGLRAGKATHRGRFCAVCRTGVCFTGPKSRDAKIDLQYTVSFQLARDRAKSRYCTEWMQFGSPSVWSMPVVLMFQHPKDDTTNLQAFEGDVPQAALTPASVDAPDTLLPLCSSVRLLLDIDEYHAWLMLHTKSVIVELEDRPPALKDREGFDMIMCGGRLNDPLYWSRATNNVYASCGRICRVCDLETFGWQHARRHRNIMDRIYRCPKCHF